MSIEIECWQCLTVKLNLASLCYSQQASWQGPNLCMPLLLPIFSCYCTTKGQNNADGWDLELIGLVGAGMSQ